MQGKRLEYASAGSAVKYTSVITEDSDLELSDFEQ
jgi:hypothetical protein